MKLLYFNGEGSGNSYFRIIHTELVGSGGEVVYETILMSDLPHGHYDRTLWSVFSV